MDKARDMLRAIADVPDDEIDLGDAALALAALDCPGKNLAMYQEHLSTLARDVSETVGLMRASLTLVIRV